MAEGSSDEALRRLMDGSAWSEFCEALKAAGAVVLAPSAPADPLDRAEGFRYLTRLTRAALESFLEASDAEAPEFQRPVGPTVKLGMDNPDNVYMSAPVNGNFEYRIHGQRGTVHYLGFGSQAGNYGATGSLPTTGYLEAKDMQIAPDGSFEIIASTRPRPGNWLPMAPETRMIQIRQTRLDHARETLAEVRIERIDAPNRPRPLDPVRLDAMLQNSARFVAGCSRLFASWAEDFEKHTNRLPRFDPDRAFRAGGDPNIAYYHSYWKLAPDEALLVEAKPPECDYWNFQLANHWLESLDYRYFKIHVNKHTAVYEPDGSVRIVIAHRDPGRPNWLDPCGHARGTMCLRWVRAKEHPEPRTRLVRLAELASG
jgi:hypothetical protein